MTKKLFGGSSASTQSNVSGYGALPAELQQYFKGIAGQGADIASNASQYFAPQGINTYEQSAADMMMPENYQASIEQYLNPFRDIITQDVNKAYEGEFGALKQRADEAGAFGGSRYREGQGDLERSRLDSIISGLSGQYNNAANQMQTGIGNLLGFGGLQRGVDFAQRQATPNALSFQSSLMSPLLSGSQGSSYNAGSSGSMIGGLGQLAGGVGGALSGLQSVGGLSGLAALFSDSRLKDNIKKVGVNNGFNIYEFNYKGSPEKYKGVMAQEVAGILPDAVIEHENGYLMVDYNKLGFNMELVA